MIVAKFGGSSLSSADGYRAVAKFIERHDIPVVIASAAGGTPKVTDLLIGAYETWKNTGSVGSDFEEAKRRLERLAEKLGYDISPQLFALEADIGSGRGYDYVVSRGEYISAFLLAKVLGYNFIDATKCIKFTQGGKIDLRSVLAHKVNIVPPCVIPGFYGAMPSGKVRLLSRGGSDISGALISSALGAEYWKCTDVEGIFDGFGGVIDRLSYDEAELLCFFGASVMQYESLAFLRNARTKLVIKGTCIDKTGTTVYNEPISSPARSLKQMLFCENIDVGYVEDRGLKVAFFASMLGRNVALVDGMGFSDAAVARILGEVRRVNVTAVVGPFSPSESDGKLLFENAIGRIYLSPPMK